MPLKTVYSYVQKLFILKHNIINTQLDRQYVIVVRGLCFVYVTHV